MCLFSLLQYSRTMFDLFPVAMVSILLTFHLLVNLVFFASYIDSFTMILLPANFMLTHTDRPHRHS
jgi:hypothetical protein